MSCLLLQLHLFDSVCSGKSTNLIVTSGERLLLSLPLLSKRELEGERERENKDERFTAC